MTLVLRVVREKRFRTQGAAADAMGMSRQWYCMVESGRMRPNEDLKKRLESFFGMPAEKLLREIEVE